MNIVNEAGKKEINEYMYRFLKATKNKCFRKFFTYTQILPDIMFFLKKEQSIDFILMIYNLEPPKRLELYFSPEEDLNIIFDTGSFQSEFNNKNIIKSVEIFNKLYTESYRANYWLNETRNTINIIRKLKEKLHVNE